MADKKITKRQVITAMLKEEAIVANADYKAYLENELALLDKKSANKKPTKAQEENEGFKTLILEVLTAEGATVSEIQAKNETLAGMSNQKVSALLRALKEEGKVVRDDSDKKRTLFKLA